MKSSRDQVLDKIRQPSPSTLRYLFSSLAALSGYYALAVVLEALDVEIECPNYGTFIELSKSI